MTTTARLVLQDAEVAANELPDPPNEFWRVRWVALVTLLRIVGHVLEKVDVPKGDVALLEASKTAWRRLGTDPPKIFAEFIEQGRNLLLKEYAFQAQQHTTVTLTGFQLTVGGLPIGVAFTPPTISSRSWTIMGDGPFSGQKPGDVARQAIAFWYAYLDGVDRAAAEIRRNSMAN